MLTCPFDGEMCAGRAVVLAVAGVGNGVRACVAARARLAAFGRARAARHRRIDHRRPARARQLFETNARAGFAVALVAQLLASKNRYFFSFKIK